MQMRDIIKNLGFRRLVECAVAVSFCLGVESAEAQVRNSTLNCSIKPQKVINISAPIGGVLSDVLVRPGQRVAVGDMIARLDMDIQKAELEGARARANAQGVENVAKARRNAAATQFATGQRAFQNRVLPKLEFSRMEADLQVADQELARAQEDNLISQADVFRLEVIVSKGEIRAPEAGVIGEQLLSKSEAIDGQAIAQLIVTNPLKVDVFADALSVEQIEAGQEFVLVAGITNPRVLPVKLDYISPIADPRSKVIKVVYTLENAAVRPGTQCFFTRKDAVETALNLARGRQP